MYNFKSTIMKKIMVPIDFSIHSENALRTAANIAKEQQAEILVVHMLEISESYFNDSESFTQERLAFYLKLTEKKIKEFLDKNYLEGIVITTIIKHHMVFTDLNNIASIEDADLIVMGSHGAKGLKELFVGSNTEKVVRSSEIPVLVTKGLPLTIDNLVTAVFACDFSKEDIIPYQKAKNIMKIFDCKLELLYVNTSGEKFKTTEQQQKLFTEFLLEAEKNTDLLNEIKTVADHTIENGILNYTSTNNVNLIIMATHGRKGLQHFIDGSISEDIVNHTNSPVLTIKI